jgi:hypothetical protein
VKYQWKKIKVRIGELVGRVSTLIALDANDHDISWNAETISDLVKLGDYLFQKQNEAVYNVFPSTQLFSAKVTEIWASKCSASFHWADWIGTLPIWQRPRQFPEHETREIERQCNELLSLDIIETVNHFGRVQLYPFARKTAVWDSVLIIANWIWSPKPKISRCLIYLSIFTQLITWNILPNFTSSKVITKYLYVKIAAGIPLSVRRTTIFNSRNNLLVLKIQVLLSRNVCSRYYHIFISVMVLFMTYW